MRAYGSEPETGWSEVRNEGMLSAVLFVLLRAPAPLPQTQADFGQIDAYLNALVTTKRNPSLSVAIAKDGKTIYAKAFGLADVQNEVTATPETVYRLGSITKQFTATMTMQLVREGKLSLEKPLKELLPTVPKAWGDVTVRQLLNHTSGIPSYTDVKDFFETYAKRPTKPAGILNVVAKMPMDFPPGSKWNYNNTGYEILGLILEKLDGRSYAASLKARILDPLGMTSTYFTSESNLVKHRAQGYSGSAGDFKNAAYLNMDWPYAAGSMESTTLDLVKWDASLYGDTILPQSVLETMWAPTKLMNGKVENYGFGWELSVQNGTRIVGHGGGINGFTTYIRRAPSKGLTVIVLTNTEGSDTGLIARDVMGLADPSLREVVAKPEIDRDPKATGEARSILQDLLSGTLKRTRLTPAFAKMVTPELMEKAHAQLGALGKIERFTFLKETKNGLVTERTYEVVIGQATMKMTLSIDDKGLIAGLGLR